MKCYDCETELQKGWHYCPNCKRKLRKGKNSDEENYVSCQEEGRCHTCSCELGADWNFCPNCGTGVEFRSTKQSLEVPTMVMEDKDIAVVPVIDSDTEDEELNIKDCLDKKEETVSEEVDTSEVTESVVGEVVSEVKEVEVRCPSCGDLMSEGHAFCASCGNPLKQQEVLVKQVDNEPKDNGFIWIIILHIIAMPLGYFISKQGFELAFYIGAFTSLFAIVCAKCKYPKSVIVNVFFWLFIVYIILVLIAGAVMIIGFAIACNAFIEEIDQVASILWNMFTLLQ